MTVAKLRHRLQADYCLQRAQWTMCDRGRALDEWARHALIRCRFPAPFSAVDFANFRRDLSGLVNHFFTVPRFTARVGSSANSRLSKIRFPEILDTLAKTYRKAAMLWYESPVPKTPAQQAVIETVSSRDAVISSLNLGVLK
jgi:hypothetical protein